MDASVSSGRAPLASVTRSLTWASLSDSTRITETDSTDAVTGAGVGVTADGRTVTSGIPRDTLDFTMVEPANATCVAVPSASRDTTSVSTPLSSRTASRPAISLPSWVEGIRTAPGDTSRTSFSSTATLGVTR